MLIEPEIKSKEPENREFSHQTPLGVNPWFLALLLLYEEFKMKKSEQFCIIYLQMKCQVPHLV